MSLVGSLSGRIFLTDFRLPPSQVILSLGSVITIRPPLPSHVHKTCSFLLGRQLLRPGGIRGLCAALFGEETEASESDVSLDKLEQFAKVVRAVPPSISPQVRLDDVVSTGSNYLTRNFSAMLYLSYSRFWPIDQKLHPLLTAVPPHFQFLACLRRNPRIGRSTWISYFLAFTNHS